jgi:hypothetical protein
MKKVAVMLLAGALVLCAQGKGKGNGGGMGNSGAAGAMGVGRGDNPNTSPGINSNSNRPGSLDRDLGRDRAEDVGKGKKKGLGKVHHAKNKHKQNS